MASVTLPVGGRRYELACRAGDEARFLRLAAIVDRFTDEAAAGGPLPEPRLLLYAALLMADRIEQAPPAAEPEPEPAFDPAAAQAVERLAERVEKLAARLEARADRP